VIFSDIVQPTHLLLLLLVVLVVLGPKRLPSAAKSLARGLGEFRSTVDGVTKPMSVDPPRRDAD
jgi:sec-independent protein translocase protein TatA